MKKLKGNEEFTLNGEHVGINVLDYWKWAYSDLLNNTYRGILAEFLVYSSFKNDSLTSQIRADWLPFDITSPSGRRIEVKSAAYLQSWTKENLSNIIFDIAPKRAWSADGAMASEKKRNSDLYVFCVYTACTREESLLNLDLWDFYVLPTYALDNMSLNQKSIGLKSLLKLNPIKTNYYSLSKIVETINLLGNL